MARIVVPTQPDLPDWAASLPPWVRPGQAVAVSGECLSTIRSRIKGGHLVARQTPSRRWLIERESLLRYLGLVG